MNDIIILISFFFLRDYNKLYSSKDPKSILNQLKYLERNKFLQDEMSNKEVNIYKIKASFLLLFTVQRDFEL